MELGFLLEKGESNAPSQSVWVEGVPERSRWTGLKLKGKRALRAVTYRCTHCGWLDFYAREG